ncbi:MAG: N-acetyltransferase [Planctomycetes bacterium]|nr:N-acetyltransferase [Planctomycetota bacterium]
MNLKIIEVKNRQAKKDFITLPWHIYQDNPYWVPPIISEEWKFLDPKVNPFFKHSEVVLFLAYNETNQPVGRIAAIINRNHIKFHQEQIGFFGLFESINSPEVARLLLETARNYLKSKGMSAMRGPMNFSVNDTCGLLIEGFDDPPTFLMPYNLTYYPDLLTTNGLSKIKDLYAYLFIPAVEWPKKISRIAQRIRSRKDIVIRSADIKNMDREVKIIQKIYNQAWQGNWGAIPMTNEEIKHMASELKHLLIPELLLIAEVNGQPVGFSLTLPDYNQAIKKINGRLWPFGIFRLLAARRKINKGRMLTMGIAKEYQRRGIDVIFYIETTKNALKLGYQEAELSWVLEDNNLMNRTIQLLGARLYKKYRIYEMKI